MRQDLRTRFSLIILHLFPLVSLAVTLAVPATVAAGIGALLFALGVLGSFTQTFG